MGVLGTELRTSVRAAVALTTEPTLQLIMTLIMISSVSTGRGVVYLQEHGWWLISACTRGDLAVSSIVILFI